MNQRCPRCDGQELKTWKELTEDEREVIQRLGESSDVPEEARRQHRWCTRCWFEEIHDSRLA